jgi:hypothetical protein
MKLSGKVAAVCCAQPGDIGGASKLAALAGELLELVRDEVVEVRDEHARVDAEGRSELGADARRPREARVAMPPPEHEHDARAHRAVDQVALS